MFGKLIEDRIQYAPRVIVNGDQRIFNPTEEMLVAAGFKPIIYDPEPEVREGYHFYEVYEELEDRIAVHYGWAENPVYVNELEEFTKILRGD